MAYIVKIEIGRTKMQSVPLPNKDRVRMYIKRNPAIRKNTRVKITNTITKKTITISGIKGYAFGLKFPWKKK